MRPLYFFLIVKINIQIVRTSEETDRKQLITNLEILWANVNLLLSCSNILMNEFLELRENDDPKVQKWAKLFICTLINMINGYLALSCLPGALEAATLLKWILDSFFDPGVYFFAPINYYFTYIMDKGSEVNSRKVEIERYLDYIVQNYFDISYIQSFKENEKMKLSPYGHIPDENDPLLDKPAENQPFWTE